jgi:hypothetical protein
MGTQDLGNTLGKDRNAVPAPAAQQPRKRNSTRAPAESWHHLDRLNGIGRHLGRLLAPENCSRTATRSCAVWPVLVGNSSTNVLMVKPA